MFPLNWFDKKDPFDEKMLQNLIEQWTKQMFPAYFQPQTNKKNAEQRSNKKMNLKEEIFETHDYIFIRIPISDRQNLKNIKIQFSHTRCTIQGLLENQRPYEIILPKPVQKKGAKAVYRDQVLEIQLVKSLDWHFGEIDIDEL